jgi:hypothetical protein
MNRKERKALSIDTNNKKFAYVFFIIDILLFAASFLLAYYIDSLNKLHDLIQFYEGEQSTRDGHDNAFVLPCLVTTMSVSTSTHLPA